MSSRRITPFLKQSLVTSGAALNTMSFGSVVGYAAILLSQLQATDSEIPLDVTAGSWIASIISITQVGGTFIAPLIMANFGRKITNIFSIVLMLTSWVCTCTSNSITVLFFCRSIQGVSLGLTLAVSSVIVGECSSPRHRGMFLVTLPMSMSFGLLLVHTTGFCFDWQLSALVFACISFINLILVLYTPESPSWLIEKGKIEDGKRVFRWLRGDSEEDELKNLIDASIHSNNTRKRVTKMSFYQRLNENLNYCKATVLKKEFFKPIIIIFHLYGILLWGGVTLCSSYIQDIIHNVVGEDANVALISVSLAAQRLVSNTCAMFLVRKVRRKVILVATIGLNTVILLSISIYTYMRSNNILSDDHTFLGITLLHMHMFTIATGSLTMPWVLSGELFALKYRSLSGGISALLYAMLFFVNVKTFVNLNDIISFSGSYALYGVFIGYCLVVVLIMMPETKDRTLQDIEEEFRGKPLTIEEITSTQRLTEDLKMEKTRRNPEKGVGAIEAVDS